MSTPRTLAVGSDHAAIPLRRRLVAFLEDLGLKVVAEVGPAEGERVDYPDQARAVATMVARGEADLGLLVCGTGIGMSIAANKVAGVRAALVHDPLTAKLAAQHNRANVLCLGGRLVAPEYAEQLVATWLETDFEARHQARIDKLTALDGAE